MLCFQQAEEKKFFCSPINNKMEQTIQKQEQEEQKSFICHSCEQEINEEDFNKDIGLCNRCVDYSDYLFEIHRDLQLED